uniref:Uncharacterized protein n=1 Tax=Caenorhabditis japonica TaxID=281687 RepID=A0A8R1DYJ5_CAEJA
MSKRKPSSIFPENSLKSFKNVSKTESVGSIYRETKHFSTITTVNGPKRIFYGKGFARIFWILVVIVVFALLVYQITLIVQNFFSKPTLSQISFFANDDGMDFPSVTICNLNPVKRSYIHNLNATGDLSLEVFNYLLATKTNSIFMFNNADRNSLRIAHENTMLFLKNHPDLEIVSFLNSAQFDCNELFPTCYYLGKNFNCCSFMTQSITTLGKCWQLSIQNVPELWIKKQSSSSMSTKLGLQIVANARHEEQFADFHYSSFQENGFRYFVHPPADNPDLAAEGITVSPSRIVNSAIKAVLHDLLNRANWGNCTHVWPAGYNTSLPYSSSVCQALCTAAYFEKLCGCAPFSYNIDRKLNTCLPYVEVACMEDKMTRFENDTEILELPPCSECHLECQKTSYWSYTSYGDGFNNSSMKWLLDLTNESESYVRENIAVVNIHFMEQFYTSYTQVKATSLTTVFSLIGGLNGLWFGMSVVSLTEIILFLSKISWIMVSRKRRHHLFVKKESEKRKEQNLEVAIQEVEESRSRMNSSANLCALDDCNPEYWYRNPQPFSNSSMDSVLNRMSSLKTSRKKKREKKEKKKEKGNKKKKAKAKETVPKPVGTI